MTAWIDTHAHLWEWSLVARAWAPPPPLDRTYAPDAWVADVGCHGVAGCILVESGSSPDDLELLQAWAETSPWILGFIAPLAVDGSDVDIVLRRWVGHGKFRGVRAHFEDGAVDLLRAPGLMPALRALADADVLFEFLVVSEHLPEVLRLCRAVPELRVVIEHMGKPQLGAGMETAWHETMAAIAAETAALVKISLSPRPDTFRTFAAAGPQGLPVDAVRTHLELLLERFGPSRLVWGSDWPVSLLTAPTDAFPRAWRELLAPVGDVLTATAGRAYRVTPPADAHAAVP